MNEVQQDGITEIEVREMGNIVNVEQFRAMGKSNDINALERQKVHFELKEMDAREEGKPNRQRQFRKEVLRLEAQQDMVRLTFHELLENEKMEEL